MHTFFLAFLLAVKDIACMKRKHIVESCRVHCTISKASSGLIFDVLPPIVGIDVG